MLLDPNEDNDDILRANRSREKKFHFDVAFSLKASQQDVYQATVVDRDIIGRVVSGYNCTVFAYGATGEIMSGGTPLINANNFHGSPMEIFYAITAYLL